HEFPSPTHVLTLTCSVNINMRFIVDPSVTGQEVAVEVDRRLRSRQASAVCHLAVASLFGLETGQALGIRCITIFCRTRAASVQAVAAGFTRALANRDRMDGSCGSIARATGAPRES